MYLKQDPVTLDEMSEALGSSKTTMSNSVSTLLDHHFIRRVWRKGVRKNLYTANKPLFKTFMQSFKNEWILAIDHQLESLFSIKRSIPDNEETKMLKSRINEMIVFQRLIKQTFQQIDIHNNSFNS